MPTGDGVYEQNDVSSSKSEVEQEQKPLTLEEALELKKGDTVYFLGDSKPLEVERVRYFLREDVRKSWYDDELTKEELEKPLREFIDSINIICEDRSYSCYTVLSLIPRKNRF